MGEWLISPKRLIYSPRGVFLFQRVYLEPETKTAKFLAPIDIPGAWTDVRTSGGSIIRVLGGSIYVPSTSSGFKSWLGHFPAMKLGASCFTCLNHLPVLGSSGIRSWYKDLNASILIGSRHDPRRHYQRNGEVRQGRKGNGSEQVDIQGNLGSITTSSLGRRKSYLGVVPQEGCLSSFLLL